MIESILRGANQSKEYYVPTQMVCFFFKLFTFFVSAYLTGDDAISGPVDLPLRIGELQKEQKEKEKNKEK